MKICTRQIPSYSPRKRGFSLVEALISLLIVGTLLAASGAAISASARTTTSQQETLRAESLARQLLSEIVQKKYQQPSAITLTLGPETGETRSTFTDVDDYAGYSESPPADSSGAAIAGYTGWTRSVDVKWADPSTLQTAALQAETNLKRIVVTVTAPSGRSWSVSALRSSNSIYDKSTSTSTYPGTANIFVQVGSSSTTSASSRVNLVNLVP